MSNQTTIVLLVAIVGFVWLRSRDQEQAPTANPGASPTQNPTASGTKPSVVNDISSVLHDLTSIFSSAKTIAQSAAQTQ